MLERYYSIDEAAEFLSKEIGEKISERSVLELAARGLIRLCIWFNGRTGLSCYRPDSLPILEEPFTVNKFVKGYIQIPKTSIAPQHREFSIPYAVLIEAFDSGNDEDKWLSRGETKIAVLPIKSFNEETHDIEYDAINVSTENALIPAQDLLDFRSKNKETEKSCTDSEKPLITTERNSLLTIIGLMAKNGYGNDLSKPYPLAKEIQKAAELLGIKISDDTIANKLKDAKTILDEKSE